MTSTEIRVSTDENVTTFPVAHLAEGTWNGFVRPYFTEATAIEITAWLNKLQAEDGNGIPEFVYGRTESGSFYSDFNADDQPTRYYDEYPTLVINGEMLHGLGVDSFAWEIAR